MHAVSVRGGVKWGNNEMVKWQNEINYAKKHAITGQEQHSSQHVLNQSDILS